MDHGRYPAPQERSNQPGYLTEQPASQTRFYRDKRNGKLFGICAGLADYTGFDVSLVRVSFLAAVFLSGGGILPFYFIAAMVTPTKPFALERVDQEEKHFWQGSPGIAGTSRARYPLTLQGHRSPSGGYRKLRDH